jgi:hypothetical protein
MTLPLRKQNQSSFWGCTWTGFCLGVFTSTKCTERFLLDFLPHAVYQSTATSKYSSWPIMALFTHTFLMEFGYGVVEQRQILSGFFGFKRKLNDFEIKLQRVQQTDLQEFRVADPHWHVHIRNNFVLPKNCCAYAGQLYS